MIYTTVDVASKAYVWIVSAPATKSERLKVTLGFRGNSATLFKYNVVLVVSGDLNYTLNGAAATKTITVTSADTAEFEFEVDASTLVSLASNEIVSEKVNSGSISSAYASWALTAPAADESISVTLSFSSGDGMFDYFVKVIASGDSAGSKSNYVYSPATSHSPAARAPSRPFLRQLSHGVR